MKHYKYVCCLSSYYALFLYLLYADEAQIDETFYVLDTDTFRSRNLPLKHCKYYAWPPKWVNDLHLGWLYYRIYGFLFLPKLTHNTQVFMQDQTLWADVYCRNHEYTFIEDFPLMCSSLLNSDVFRWKRIIQKDKTMWLKRRMYGPIHTNCFANNPLATRLLLSQDDPAEYLAGKECIVIPPMDKNLWDSFSEQKRKRILELYSVGTEDLDLISKADTILLTQPFEQIPQNELIDTYRKILQHYDTHLLIIKTHPRDTIRYQKHFPDIKVYNKVVPLELFVMLSSNVKTAITITSLAALHMPKDVTIHWYGANIHPTIADSLKGTMPPKADNIVLCTL